jgi:Cu/Ag efflux pump CusA
VPIRVKLPVESRRDFSTLENLPVPTVTGDTVPLSRVARSVWVGADLDPAL